MSAKSKLLQLNLLSALISFHCFSQTNAQNIEVISVTGKQLKNTDIELSLQHEMSADVSDWLYSVAGLDANKNGQLSGIAQMRGYAGQFVNKNINGIQISSAGPNAMDAPLSYVPTSRVESIEVFRGIAPVSHAIDSVAGTIKVNLNNPNDLLSDSTEGTISAARSTNGYAIDGLYNQRFQSFSLLGYVQHQDEDDYQDAHGADIIPSRFQRTLSGLELGYQTQYSEHSIAWDHSETKDTGTPALAMDIDYIRSNRIIYKNETQHLDNVLSFNFSMQDAEHGMDNYSLRNAPMPAMHRYNTTAVEGFNYALSYAMDELKFGIDGYHNRHDSVITNPNNDMFEIINFNHVLSEKHSIFGEYQHANSWAQFYGGLRVKYIKDNADEVSHSMAMQSPAIKQLQDDFNNQNRNRSNVDFDMVASTTLTHSQHADFVIAIAQKQQSPSYQQLYLWLPLQATGGLADGYNYIGDTELESQTASQIDLAYRYQDKQFTFKPSIYYHQINDYIQGVPSDNMQANMVSKMMNPNPALQFTNIDATLWGSDIQWQWRLNTHWLIQGSAAITRGKRDDLNEDLYRITPDNAHFNLSYFEHSWQASVNLIAYKKQNRVSQLTQEAKSPGYGVVNLQYQWHGIEQIKLSLGINNLFDKAYTPHLNGVNRAKGSDILVGNKIPQQQRNAYAKITWHF